MNKLLRRLFPLILLLTSAVAQAATFEETLREGETFRERGQIHLAIDTLEPLQGKSENPDQEARLAGALGHAHYLLHQPEHRQAALTLLEQAANSERLPKEARGRYANLLANSYFDGGEEDAGKAAEWYGRALVWAAGNPALALTIKLNQTRLLPRARQLEVLATLFDGIAALPDSPGQSRLFLSLGKQAHKLGAPALEISFKSLQRASDGARKQGGKPLLSEALGALGQLYEEQNRTDEALRLTEAALREAQGGQDHGILWPLDAQLGRLLPRQGRDDEALAAFRRAVRHIEAVRHDIPIRYDAQGRSSFRDTLAPIYLALADLLLRTSENARNSQELLREARDTIELSRQAELEDFLGDRCAIQGLREDTAGAVEAHTAVLYPLILPDRLELLLEIKGRLRRFTTLVGEGELKSATLDFARVLRSSRRLPFEVESKRLYDWLIAPLEPVLRENGITTLLAVPDDFLRLIPLSALHDGKQYLIERYAPAISPALTVLAGHSVDKPAAKLLLAGLSQPPGDYAPLPGVKKEVMYLYKQFNSDLLLDGDFKIETFQSRLTAGGHSIVHIASHGEFEGEAKDTYIMAYDGKIHLDTLEKLLKTPAQNRVALDLLSFSACQTAAGNDRAPLGFSGMAIRAKAHSVIGTLWQVNDVAAQKIMTAFYRQKITNGLGKAEALRRAQLEWLKEPNLSHPFYWSAFILVGDWL
jgi:CHAT domain-containing protein